MKTKIIILIIHLVYAFSIIVSIPIGLGCGLKLDNGFLIAMLISYILIWIVIGFVFLLMKLIDKL